MGRRNANPLTLRAVRRQLDALRCPFVTLTCWHEDTGRGATIEQYVRPEDVPRLLPDLAWRNANGANLYVAPVRCLNRALVLVDDVEQVDIDRLAEAGMEPCCVVETSPKNNQVWIDLGPEEMPEPERAVFARFAARFANGDPAAAAGYHNGRLAGFTNRKAAHFGEGGFGRYPYVLVRTAMPGRTCSAAGRIRAWARAEAERVAASETQITSALLQGTRVGGEAEAWETYAKEWAANPNRRTKADGSDDLSARDYGVVSRMLKEGFGMNAVRRVLASASEARGKKHASEYATRTVERAAKRLEDNA